MSDYMAAQQTLDIAFDSTVEVVTPGLEKIGFSSSGEVLLQRPDKLRVHRLGGYADVEMVLDGQTVTVTDLTDKRFARLDLTVESTRSARPPMPRPASRCPGLTCSSPTPSRCSAPMWSRPS